MLGKPQVVSVAAEAGRSPLPLAVLCTYVEECLDRGLHGPVFGTLTDSGLQQL